MSSSPGERGSEEPKSPGERGFDDVWPNTADEGHGGHEAEILEEPQTPGERGFVGGRQGQEAEADLNDRRLATDLAEADLRPRPTCLLEFETYLQPQSRASIGLE